MPVVHVSGVVRQFECRRVFVYRERALDTHAVDIDAAAGGVLQFYHAFVVAVRTDGRGAEVPCRVGVHRPVHTLVAQRTGGFVVREIERRFDGELVPPFFHVLRFSVEDILRKRHHRRACRDGHKDMITAYDIRQLTRFFHIVLSCQLDMVPQTVVRLVFVLVERPNERSAVFGSQIRGAERHVATEEELIMELGSARSAYAQTDTFQHVPAEELVNGSEVELAFIQIARRRSGDKLRRDGIDRRNGGGYLVVVGRFAHQVIYRVLVPCQRLRAQRIPCCGSETLRRRVIHFHFVRRKRRERLARDRVL